MGKIGHIPLGYMGQWSRAPVPLMGVFPPWRWVTIMATHWGLVLVWEVSPWRHRTTVPCPPWDSFHPHEDIELPWYTLPGACLWMVDPRQSRVSSFGAGAGTLVPAGGLLVLGKDPGWVVDKSTFLGLTSEPLGGEGGSPLWAMLHWEWEPGDKSPLFLDGVGF